VEEEIQETDYSKGWKAPRLAAYNGMGDTDEHTHMFITEMEDMMT